MVRILTYNVHRCLGADGHVSTSRIASIVASCRPDIVALQELDVRRMRTGGVDQAHAIAREAGLGSVHFHPAFRVLEEEYGDAILSSLPSRLLHAGPLPGLASNPLLEPRGALWASIDVLGRSINVINTHLGLWPAERLAQVDALLGPQWIGDPRCTGPTILLGDFNAVPRSRPFRRLAAALHDARGDASRRGQSTFPSRFPVLRLDHVFFRGELVVVRSEVIRTPLARIASDHLPLLVEFELGQPNHSP